MGTSERRIEIMKKLSNRRHDTIYNLAQEFGVSERTIRRDICVLSLTEPIYTQSGRYSGGVYMMDDHILDYVKLSNSEIELLNTLHNKAKTDTTNRFTKDEILQLQCFIKKYSTNKNKK